MADFYDITNWNEKPWFQTGGTRSKVIIENPENRKIYYFKTSLKKEKIDYKYEFWSEIIASEVGTLLGFDLLRYDIAFNSKEIGCISESMTQEGVNKLTEGVSYLTGYDTTYNPKDKNSKKQYTFQLIFEALGFFQLSRFAENIIQIIIFDSIIGNSDRHQENWGIITTYNDIIATIEEIAKKEKKGFFEKQLFSLLAITSKAKRKDLENVVKNLHLIMPGNFSQIYDSGSCLGRELSDEKTEQMLMDKSLIDTYIRKGVSEIHWEGKKLNHFDLIRKVNNVQPEMVRKTIQKVISNYNENKIQSIVNNIDLNLPKKLVSNKLPIKRKELVIKLITLRVQNLTELIK